MLKLSVVKLQASKRKQRVCLNGNISNSSAANQEQIKQIRMNSFRGTSLLLLPFLLLLVMEYCLYACHVRCRADGQQQQQQQQPQWQQWWQQCACWMIGWWLSWKLSCWVVAGYALAVVAAVGASAIAVGCCWCVVFEDNRGDQVSLLKIM